MVKTETILNRTCFCLVSTLLALLVSFQTEAQSIDKKESGDWKLLLIPGLEYSFLEDSDNLNLSGSYTVQLSRRWKQNLFVNAGASYFTIYGLDNQFSIEITDYDLQYGLHKDTMHLRDRTKYNQIGIPVGITFMPQRNDWRFPLSFDLVPMLNVRRVVFRENLTREKIEWAYVESGFGLGMTGQASIGFLRQLDNMEMGLTASTRFGILRGSANFPSPAMIALNVVIRIGLFTNNWKE